jgi:hypothetical protein
MGTDVPGYCEAESAAPISENGDRTCVRAWVNAVRARTVTLPRGLPTERHLLYHPEQFRPGGLHPT